FGVTHVKEGDRVITTWVDRDNATTPLVRVDHALNDREQYAADWKGREVSHSAATWAEYALASERVVLPLPSDLPTDVTAIVGCAGIGLCAVAAAAIVDAHPIIVVDVNDRKLAFAKKFGATHTINSKTADALAAIRDLTGGGADFAVDAIGLPATQEQILRAVRPGYAGLN